MNSNEMWQRLRALLAKPSTATAPPPAAPANPHHASVTQSLRALLDDTHIPSAIRQELAADFKRIEAMLDKLERDELHIAVFGRVSVGKSALGNALLGHDAFTVGVLHGTTTEAVHARIDDADGGGLVLIDTPGINELDGEQRERLAFEVAEISDLVIFVVDSDLTRDELAALQTLAQTQRPLLLVLNKADRYSNAEQTRLLAHLRERCKGLVQAENVLAVSAQPAPLKVTTDDKGMDTAAPQPRAPAIEPLRQRLHAIVAHEGKALAAVNAGLFAGRLTDQVSARIAATRRQLASKVIHQYCIAKGVMVALNPIPVADLLAAAGLDAAMVVQLSRVYGLPLTRAESGRLVATISVQLIALMGAIWGVHLVASALKVVSVGLSTAVTAGFQGALAWYATTLIGRAAESYLVHGKSWGEHGAKRAVREVVESLDRDSILRDARAEILRRLKQRKSPTPT